MEGYYVCFHCDQLPVLSWLFLEYVKGPFTAAYHEHFEGGWNVELVCETSPCLPKSVQWDSYMVRKVHVMEFFSASLLEVGGVYVDSTGVVDTDITKPHTEEWKKRMGQLSFALDSVDISHPRAVHASDYSM